MSVTVMGEGGLGSRKVPAARRMLLALVSVGLLLATAVLTARAETTPAGVNGKIAFLESEDDERRAIHVINPDGTAHTRLTTNQANNVSLAWSPDGRRIAFVSDGDGRDNYYDIYIINADGSGRTQLTSGGAGSPAWSPDGTKIAFPDGEIYTVKPDGTGLTRISHTEVSSDPAWSPDGRQIVFVGLANGHREIFKVNADGTGQTRLTTTAPDGFNLDFRGPTWSPDGTKIAFESNRETHCQSVGCARIYVMNADGSGLERLTKGPRGSYAPEWSPGGTRIAFFSYQDGNYELYRINPDGTGETRLTHNDLGDVNHVWSPDGTKIVVERWAPGPNRLYVVDADDGSERFLAPGARPDWQRLPRNAPPDCAPVVATPSELFPANRKLRLVTLTGATDPDGDTVTVTINEVSQDEPLTARGDRTAPDARRASGTHAVLLRAERSPRGDGRVYEIAFRASDGKGGTCSGTASVTVARHKGKTAVDSAPPSYDSFDG